MKEQRSETYYDAIVIGAGSAGLSTAIYLARAKYRVLVIEKEQIGGQITITSEIVNYPGVIKSSGKELTGEMRKQAEYFGAEFLMAEVEEIQCAGQWKEVRTSKETYETLGIILATGANPRKIGFPGEEKYQGRGIAYCATCDGEFFAGMDIFVLGGGFAAAEESMFLTKYAKRVYLMVREPDFTCAKSIAEKVMAHPGVEVHFETEIVEAGGGETLEYAVFREKNNVWEYRPEEGKTFGIFVFAGYVPDNKLFLEKLETTEEGYLVTDRNQKTSKEGVYGAGDVCQKNLRQVVTAVADGAVAATSLESYLAEQYEKLKLHKRKWKTKAIDKDAEKDKVAESISAGETSTVSGSFFTKEIKEQLLPLLETFEKSIVLKVLVNHSDISKEAENFAKELSKLSNKVSCEIKECQDQEQAVPAIRLCDGQGKDMGCIFHGVPGGHEFNSFVIAMYNMAGKGQKIEQELLQEIHSINREIKIQVIVSLSCTMCPDLVMAAQRIALENPKVQTDIYDMAHFPELKEKYRIMSVPCMIINEKRVYFGRKGIREILDILGEKF